MKFKTIAEAFNHYRTSTLEEIETRAAAIKKEIGTDSKADIDALNIELEGLTQAKANLAEKRSSQEAMQNNGNPNNTNNTNTSWNPITRMDIQTGASHQQGDILASREYRNAFHKFMLNQPLSGEESSVIIQAQQTFIAEKRDSSFMSTSSNSAVIPTGMLEEIFKLAANEGGILQQARRFNIPANVAVPVATPSAMAEWHVEGEEVDPATVHTTKVTFAGHELMKVFSISAAARSMSISAFESYLQQELSRTMITALQHAAIHGTGTNQPTGLLNTPINNFSGDGNYKSFVQAIAGLHRGYSMGAAWAMNNSTLYNQVVAMVDGNQRPLFNQATDGAPDRILGKPVVIDDFLSDDFILLGNFQYYAMNYPQSIMLEVSRDSSFRRGLIDYRALAVADGKPIISEAFVGLSLSSV